MKGKPRRPWAAFFLITVFIFFLTACGGAAEEPAVEGTTPVEETSEAVTPVPMDLEDVTVDTGEEDSPSEMPEPGIPDPQAFMTDQVTSALAERLGVDREAISVQSAEEVEWPDTALGCPNPDEGYAQVITPGYEITLAAEGETYTYHTDKDGAYVLCGDDGRPVGAATTITGDSPGLELALDDDQDDEAVEDMNQPERNERVTPTVVDLSQITPEVPSESETLREMPQPGIPNPSVAASNKAAADLARTLGLDVNDVDVVTVEQVDWPDSSLGCPEAGQSYLTVVTPGFQILLEAGGQQYEYHADIHGNVVNCTG